MNLMNLAQIIKLKVLKIKLYHKRLYTYFIQLLYKYNIIRGALAIYAAIYQEDVKLSRYAVYGRTIRTVGTIKTNGATNKTSRAWYLFIRAIQQQLNSRGLTTCLVWHFYLYSYTLLV